MGAYKKFSFILAFYIEMYYLLEIIGTVDFLDGCPRMLSSDCYFIYQQQ